MTIDLLCNLLFVILNCGVLSWIEITVVVLDRILAIAKLQKLVTDVPNHKSIRQNAKWAGESQ